MNAVSPRTRQRMLPFQSRELTWTRIPCAAQQEAIKLFCRLILEHVRVEPSARQDARSGHEG
jgi:hypothetical protein